MDWWEVCLCKSTLSPVTWYEGYSSNWSSEVWRRKERWPFPVQKSSSHVDRWMGKVKVYTRFIESLHQTAFTTWQCKKTQFSVRQPKWNMHPLQGSTHPVIHHIINAHTNQVKLYVWICPAAYQPKHTFDLKKSNFGCVGFQEEFDTPPLKLTKTNPVAEISTHPLLN